MATTKNEIQDSPIEVIANGARDVAESVKERLGSARDAATDRLDGVAGKVGDATADAGKRAGKAIAAGSKTISQFVKDRPLTALASAFALGYVAMRVLRR
jgi:hypothetical protein